MNPRRRRWLSALAALALPGRQAPAAASTTTPAAPALALPAPPTEADDDAISPRRTLRWPRDHGAHPAARIEWWYATGWLDPADGSGPIGWQLTFFRSRTGLAGDLPGRFAARQLLFAHAAVSDIAAGRHRHAQRVGRWSGDEATPEAHARRADAALALGPWRLTREPGPSGAEEAGRWHARLAAPEAGFTLALTLTPTQPLLLQGQAGFSRKGPLPGQASHYVSLPQLTVQAELALDGRTRRLAGSGWLDHEWSDELMPPEAVGWDWIGINLHDGGALTAFVLRRRDGRALWAGGSHRPAGGAVRDFAPQEVAFTPVREWTSPATGARYPVHWRIATPLGGFELEALLDAQELDSRASTGAVYWEGLCELRAAGAGRGGRRLGLGYLEMTGRFSPLRLG